MSIGFDYWNKHSADYPFHAQEDRTDKKMKVPFNAESGPTYKLLYGDFLRCPAPEIGVVFWGFLSEDALKRFLFEYGLPDERGKGGPA